ncbi:MAG: putative NTP pyrophosphohydrolase [Rhodobacteraceae bacterium HLUCCO07]|nr:MAG: putative NTP pyrophosphohydrolase [Rhodobacteraceae bacterium HLUCCO07]
MGQRRMTLQNTRQLPLRINASHKSDVRTQFAALCYRVNNGKPEILLITSRGRKRWIVPKGWPMHGVTPGTAALQEAWEEAGVQGKAVEHCLGVYSYPKEFDDGTIVSCVAMVYPVRVKALAHDFPEAGQRQRKWFSPKKAAAKVSEPELGHILRSFDHRLLKP